MALTTLIGLTAGILTTASFLPQAIKIFKTKKAGDISLLMYVAINIGTFLWLVYGLLIKEIPIIFANLITFSLAFTILILKIKNK